MYLVTKSNPNRSGTRRTSSIYLYASMHTWHHSVCRSIMTTAALHNPLVWSSPAKPLLPHPSSASSATKVFLVSTYLLTIVDGYIKALQNTGNAPSTKPVKPECNHYYHGSNDKWHKASGSFASSAHLARLTNGQAKPIRVQCHVVKRHALSVPAKIG